MTHRLVLAAAAPAIVLCAAFPAMAQQQTPWAGWYVGANLGGVWGDASASVMTGPGTGAVVIPPADVSAINGASSGSSSTSGFTGGVEGGFNWVNQGILFGIESDWGAMDISQDAHRTVNSTFTLTPPLVYNLHNSVHTDWVWTLRPRFGFAGADWLVYGTVGLAVTDVKNSLTYADTSTPGRTASASSSDTKTGWVGGLGAAYAFTPQWSVKGEWLYTDFGTVSATAATPDGFVTTRSEASVRGNMFRVGVDYRF
jgi:outer membrane immunogenic protein